MVRIQNVTLLTPHGSITDGVLDVAEGRIARLGSHAAAGPPPSGVTVIDGQGGLLTPGFIDLQLNGAFGLDFTRQPESIWTVAVGLPRYGVTAFLPTIVTSPPEVIRGALAAVQRVPAGFAGAQPLGLHIEGPFINPGKKGAHNPDYIRPATLAETAGWSPETGVRLVTLAPEQPGALDVIAALCGRGVRVSAGHSLATFEQAQAGFAAGIRYGTHLFNAQPALDHREPGLSAALLTDPSVVAGLIADGVHVHPAMVDLAWRLKGPQGINLVTDAMAALGMPPGRYRLGDFEVEVDEHSVRLAGTNTLAGSILALDEAVRNLMTFTGCSLSEAVQTVTATPARLLGLTDRGALAVGAWADLALLSPDGSVRLTLTQGRVVYSASDFQI
jgi:N-acetylglucosamine-6-phosphate deacetylase